MAAPATQNPAANPESKSARKKKAKIASTDSEAATAEIPASNGPADSASGDGSYESPYIKELYKNIRNINKKISNASKVDSIVTENPDKTLDQLVTERKINADQKAQILKKPALKLQLQQFEEQIAAYKKFDQEYKTRTQAEKTEFEKTFTERASKELEDAVTTAKAEATVLASKEQEDQLLLLSQFLRLAALRRGEDEDAELEENRALEGLLAKVYTGDLTAVAAMLKLINGSSDQIQSVGGDVFNVSYSDIKAAAIAQPPPVNFVDAAAEPTPEAAAAETNEYPIESDPTIANAGLTELDEPVAIAPVNGHSEATELQGVPQNSGFGEGGNAVAEGNWDTQNDLSQSQEWVEISRDPAETDTGVTATPAAPSNVQSWADDQPDSPSEVPGQQPADKELGFQEVPQRNRPSRGPYRGRGRGGDGYRGRGRGGGDGFRGGRGNRGGPRGGGRRSDES